MSKRLLVAILVGVFNSVVLGYAALFNSPAVALTWLFVVLGVVSGGVVYFLLDEILD